MVHMHAPLGSESLGTDRRRLSLWAVQTRPTGQLSARPPRQRHKCRADPKSRANSPSEERGLEKPARGTREEPTRQGRGGVASNLPRARPPPATGGAPSRSGELAGTPFNGGAQGALLVSTDAPMPRPAVYGPSGIMHCHCTGRRRIAVHALAYHDLDHSGN